MTIHCGADVETLTSISSMTIESISRVAYSTAQALHEADAGTREKAPWLPNPPGVGRVLRALARNPPVHAVDLGIRPGYAHVEFTTPHPLDKDYVAGCLWIRVAKHQTKTQTTMSYGRAAAIFMAWLYSQKWAPELTDAVAMAIVMPEPAVQTDLRDGFSAADLARAYVVDPAIALQRLRMLRGTHDSCERPAFSVDRIGR